MTRTRIEIKNLKNGFKLRISGHAPRDNGDLDFNMCCAGISMLAATAVNTFTKMDNDGELETLQRRYENGYVYLKAIPQRRYMKDTRAYAKMLKMGFETLKKRYPDKVQLVG